jgi:hypothetical protein
MSAIGVIGLVAFIVFVVVVELLIARGGHDKL